MENASENEEFNQIPQIEVTDEMLEAGEQARRRWYGEPGEGPHCLRRAAEEVFLAMLSCDAAPRMIAAGEREPFE